MSSLDYLDLCRLCLVKDRVSVPIFEGEGDVRQIFLKIAACLPVKVTREDKLPKKICDDCVYKVELLYQFWNTTANAEKQLLQWLGEVGLEDKQSYVTGVLNPNVMKQEQNGENRLDGNAMQQVNAHQPNMGMGMMDNMGMGMPLMMSTASQQQMTSVPMDTSGNPVQSVQAVPGPSTQTTHDQMAQNQANAPPHQDEEEESSEEEENSDDDCDGDEGLPVKEESEEDPSNSRTLEPTTFVNVSLACDEPGPSGLQQQKIAEMPEMSMPQVADGDPKSGRGCGDKMKTDMSGLFIVEKDSLSKQLSQVTSVDGNNPRAKRADCNEELANSIDIKVEIDEELDLLRNTNELTDIGHGNENRYLESLAHFCEVAIGYYTCDKCCMKLPVENILNRHKVAHEHRTRSTTQSIKRYTPQSSLRLQFPCRSCNCTCLKKNSSLNAREKSAVYLCRFCDFKCDKRTALLSHVTGKHNSQSFDEVREYKCSTCDFECSKKGTLYSHKRKHNTQNVYSCDGCGFKTNNKSSLYSHIKRKHKSSITGIDNDAPEYFFCSQCDYKNKNKYELKVHVARKHSDDFKFSCDICSKKFKVKGDLTNHIRFTHKEQPIICDVCGKTCMNSNSLYVHQKFAHYKAKYECNICKRRMVSQENLNEHMLKQHENRDNVVCEECGKTFSRSNRLKIHMRIHTGDKPYPCNICSKTFARKTALKQHLLIHTGKRPYVCDVCGKAFTQKPGLISHRKSHPGPHPPLPRILIDHILNDVNN